MTASPLLELRDTRSSDQTGTPPGRAPETRRPGPPRCTTFLWRSVWFLRLCYQGYDFVLNEEASNVSQGQKQLLTIARAILTDPTILILDEATSSVDTRTEVLIQTAMVELMKDRTSFIIAHRLSTIRDADWILVMNNGDIVEQGKHEKLLARGGFYADLYNSQFENAQA